MFSAAMPFTVYMKVMSKVKAVLYEMTIFLLRPRVTAYIYL